MDFWWEKEPKPPLEVAWSVSMMTISVNFENPHFQQGFPSRVAQRQPKPRDWYFSTLLLLPLHYIPPVLVVPACLLSSSLAKSSSSQPQANLSLLNMPERDVDLVTDKHLSRQAILSLLTIAIQQTSSVYWLISIQTYTWSQTTIPDH